MVVIIFLIILSIFLILSRRKLAYFTLALLAGVVLDQYLNGEIVNFLAASNLNISKVTLVGISGLALILTPAMLLLPKNPKQESWIFGILVSIFNAFLALILLHSHLSRVFNFDGNSKFLAENFEKYAGFMILAAVILAIFSVLSFKFEKLDKKS